MNGHQRNKAGNRGEKPLPRGAGRQPPLSGRRVCRERDPAGWGRSAVLSARKPDGRDPEASGLVRGSVAWYTVCFAGGGGGCTPGWGRHACSASLRLFQPLCSGWPRTAPDDRATGPLSSPGPGQGLGAAPPPALHLRDLAHSEQPPPRR